MRKEKTHEKEMLEKYPNLYKGESCYTCKADLRYLDRIHRINFEWYCDKCYLKKKHIFPNILDPTKHKGNLNLYCQVKEKTTYELVKIVGNKRKSIIEVKNRKGNCSKGICPIVNGICLRGHKNSCCNCFYTPKKRKV